MRACAPQSAGYSAAGLHFGPVENFAGLERPYVIVTGMQHPHYLVHRKENEGRGDGSSAVDSRVYLAVTRRTFELMLIEVEVEEFGAHFKISGCSAAFEGRANHDGQAPHAALEPAGADEDGMRCIRLG